LRREKTAGERGGFLTDGREDWQLIVNLGRSMPV
jgi:hypothetical protein